MTDPTRMSPQLIAELQELLDNAGRHSFKVQLNRVELGLGLALREVTRLKVEAETCDRVCTHHTLCGGHGTRVE